MLTSRFILVPGDVAFTQVAFQRFNTRLPGGAFVASTMIVTPARRRFRGAAGVAFAAEGCRRRVSRAHGRAGRRNHRRPRGIAGGAWTCCVGRRGMPMSRDATSTHYIGERRKRIEDVPFLTGTGEYASDLRFEHMAELAIVRSPHPHARIVRVDAAPARAVPGVIAAFSARELPEVVQPVPRRPPRAGRRVVAAAPPT